MKNVVIGIEGMVASGKTSICKELVKIVPNSVFIDGGNIYRGIAMAISKSGIDISKMSKASNVNPFELMKQLQVEFKIEDNITQIYIGGNKIDEDEIQSMRNAMDVSQIASKNDNTALFGFARNIIDMYVKQYNVIVSARDLVDIYPNMDVHAYITASLEERTKRRFNQYNGVYSIDEIRDMIEKRDLLHEKAGFNKTCLNTINVDVTDCASSYDSAMKVLDVAKEKGLINLSL